MDEETSAQVILERQTALVIRIKKKKEKSNFLKEIYLNEKQKNPTSERNIQMKKKIELLKGIYI